MRLSQDCLLEFWEFESFSAYLLGCRLLGELLCIRKDASCGEMTAKEVLRGHDLILSGSWAKIC